MNATLLYARSTASKEQLLAELREALGRTPPDELSSWGARAAKRFIEVGVKRVTGLASLLKLLTMRSADETVRIIRAIQDGKLPAHAMSRGRQLRELVSDIGQRGRLVTVAIASKASQSPSEAATHLCSLVAGFYAGSGGDGDGGIPDLDLLAGIGAHRSIFTHSIIAGAVVETAVLSVIDLVQVVHRRLPVEHSSFWDHVLRHSEIGGSTFVSGASMGIATHLGVDTLVDGFTPYKDLPISLPEGVHEVLMGMNAAAEGAYGASRYEKDIETLLQGLRPRPKADVWVEVETHGSVRNHNPKESLLMISGKSTAPPAMLHFASAEESLEAVAKLVNNVDDALGGDCSAAREALIAAARKLELAQAPFQLGMVGEFRVGKSTLINALIGKEVAFTDFLEATPIRCVFRHGDFLGATLHLVDGSTTQLSVEEANGCLAEHRDDQEWIGRVLHMEYRVPSAGLESFDLWDAPGLGGSESHDLRAYDHLERLGGALWVLDATMMGNASVSGPLMRMHDAGKPLICILNRIDEYHDSQTDLFTWVEQACPGVFSTVVPFSARDALAECAGDQLGASVSQLWSVINTVMGAGAEEGATVRAERTAEQVLQQVSLKVMDLRRDIQDRVGLLEHYRLGLEASREECLQALPNIISNQANLVFQELTGSIFAAMALETPGEDPIARATALMRDQRTHDRISDRVMSEGLEHLRDEWYRLSGESLELSLTAIPLSGTSLMIPPPASTSARQDALGEKAIDSGVYAGGLTVIITGTIAAISTIVSWPVILAAIPIGALQAWKTQADISRAHPDFNAQIESLVAQMKREFLSHVMPNLSLRIQGALTRETDELLRAKAGQLLNGSTVERAGELVAALQRMEDSLVGRAKVPTADVFPSDLVLKLFENPGSRLDILTPTLDFSLAPLLHSLPATTEVRLLFVARVDSREAVEKVVAAAFGSWPGKRSVRAIRALQEGESLSIETMLISPDHCLVSRDTLHDLFEGRANFSPFARGKTAGQHQFAEMWEGRPLGGMQITSMPVL